MHYRKEAGQELITLIGAAVVDDAERKQTLSGEQIKLTLALTNAKPVAGALVREAAPPGNHGPSGRTGSGFDRARHRPTCGVLQRRTGEGRADCDPAGPAGDADHFHAERADQSSNSPRRAAATGQTADGVICPQRHRHAARAMRMGRRR